MPDRDGPHRGGPHQDETSRNVRFIGGPLDGRTQELRDAEAVTGRLLRHIHLHEGPKIETQYELRYTPENGWEYHLSSHGKAL